MPLAADTRKGAAVGTDYTFWRIVPACAGRRSLPGGLDTAASRAILLSDAKRIGWTAFLTPTCRKHNAFSISANRKCERWHHSDVPYGLKPTRVEKTTRVAHLPGDHSQVGWLPPSYYFENESSRLRGETLINRRQQESVVHVFLDRNSTFRLITTWREDA